MYMYCCNVQKCFNVISVPLYQRDGHDESIRLSILVVLAHLQSSFNTKNQQFYCLTKSFI